MFLDITTSPHSLQMNESALYAICKAGRRAARQQRLAAARRASGASAEALPNASPGSATR